MFPEERKRMFTSKIIKTEDDDTTAVRDFLMQQFPGGETPAQKKSASRRKERRVRDAKNQIT